MDIVFAAGFQAGNAEAKGYHFDAVESAQDLAADFIGDDEKTLREKFDIVIAPDFALEAHDGGEFLQLDRAGEFRCCPVGLLMRSLKIVVAGSLLAVASR